MTSDYARAVGEKLRGIRTQKGMSLHDVQEASAGKWKAAVIGAYERGDRNVTVARLADLAGFYGVPIGELLPDETPRVVTEPAPPARVAINLEQLERLPEGQRSSLRRFATAIQIQRGDFNGRVLTIRQDDLMALALLYQTSSDEMSQRLAEWGLLVEPAPRTSVGQD
jgi:transcriptional regulator with XRE-family HTH domain